jgi:hypothetical protein
MARDLRREAGRIRKSQVGDLANEALKTDQLSLEGCYHTEDMRGDVTHLFAKCPAEVPCVTCIRYILDLYICEDCQSR